MKWNKKGLFVVVTVRYVAASNDVVLNYKAKLEKGAEEKHRRK